MVALSGVLLAACASPAPLSAEAGCTAFKEAFEQVQAADNAFPTSGATTAQAEAYVRVLEAAQVKASAAASQIPEGEMATALTNYAQSLGYSIAAIQGDASAMGRAEEAFLAATIAYQNECDAKLQ